MPPAPHPKDRMQIDWNHFTPWASLAGGALIGGAAALYLLGTGRIAGIAGIVASPLQALLKGSSMRPELNRLLFVLGLLAAPLAWRLLAPLPTLAVDVGPLGLVAAGLLVGLGGRLGNGCTSGHGVCGLSRFSGRSLANVLAFMGTGFAVVYLTRHLLQGAA